MKVMFINAVYGYGSTGVIVRDLEQMLLEHDEEAMVVYQNADIQPINGYRVGNLLDWKYHALYTRIWGKQAYASVYATKKLAEYIKKETPDIVHLHNLHSNYINLKILLSCLIEKQIPIVLTLHDCWFFTGKCCHFVGCNCEKWKIECNQCPQNKSDVKSMFFDNTTRVFKDKKELFQDVQHLTIVGCSEWIRDLARQSPMFQGKRFECIHNGVDIQMFSPKNEEEVRNKYNLQEHFVILGMANKWMDSRNTKILSMILNNMDENDRLVLVGCRDGQKELLRNNEKVLMLDFIYDRNEMAELYSMSNVFINLTFEDTLPTVNMEATCCGTPVITYDSGGCAELVKHNETGYIISPLDGVALQDAIFNIKKHKISRETCRQYGEVHFDNQKRYIDYLDLYRNLLNNS